MNLDLTRQQTKDMIYNEGSDELGLVLHKEGDWSVDHKYQHQELIYFQESTGKYYSMQISRSGSPFTDYYYSYEDSGSELCEVKLVEITVKEWQAV